MGEKEERRINHSGVMPRIHTTAKQYTRYLWLGGACLFVGGMAGKQFLWSTVSGKVTNIRDLEAEKASAYLKDTYSNAAKYRLPPLTDQEKEIIRGKLARGEIKDIGKFRKVEERDPNPPIMTSSPAPESVGGEEKPCCEGK